MAKPVRRRDDSARTKNLRCCSREMRSDSPSLSPFLKLPNELMVSILQFLSVEETMRLRLVCKAMKDIFPYQVIKPSVKIIRSLSTQVYSRLHTPERAGIIEIPSAERIHTALIKCNWDYDSPFKKLYLVAHKDDGSELTFWSGKIVSLLACKVEMDTMRPWNSGENRTELVYFCSFRPSAGERYSLWLWWYSFGRLQKCGYGVLSTYCVTNKELGTR